MAWRIVKQPNGLYARWSEVVDHFTDYNMSKDEALFLCKSEYKLHDRDAKQKVVNADCDNGRFEDCIKTLSVLHGVKYGKAWRTKMARQRTE